MTHHQGLLVPEHDHHRMAIAVRTLLAPEEIRAAARALTARSSTFGREHPLRTLKALFQSGRLRYRADDSFRGTSRAPWYRPAATLQRGGGDCEDLAILLAAMLNAHGWDASVVIGSMWQGGTWGGHAWVAVRNRRGEAVYFEATNATKVAADDHWQYRAEVVVKSPARALNRSLSRRWGAA